MRKLTHRAVYAVTIATILAMAGGYAFAATFGTLGTTTQVSSIGSGTVTPLAGVTFVSTSTSYTNPGTTVLGVHTAGTPSDSLAGTPTVIATCATGTCVDTHAYVPAAGEGPATVLADFAEQFTITVVGGTPNFDLTINFQGQTVATSIVYVAPSGVATGATDLVYLYIDLGAITPTITGYTVVGNSCGATCP